MRRAALTSLLLVSVAACSSRPEGRLQELYDSTTTQLRRGELRDAVAGAKEGAGLASRDSVPAWTWRFKLLTAEIHLLSRSLPEAGVLLQESPRHAGGDEWSVAKHRYLQGQLAFLRGNATEASTILDDAWRLAADPSAADMRLDIGAMKGQAFIAQRKWDEAEAILEATTELARTRGDRHHEVVALVNLGNVYLFRARFDHALQFLERAIEFKDLESQTVYAVALTNAGICYQRLGEIDRAIDVQERAVVSHERPGRPRVFYARALGELGATYLVKGDIENAIAYFRRAMDVGKEAGLAADVANWATNVTLARIRSEEWPLAQEANEEARRLGKDRADLAGYLASNSAEIALGLGKREEAGRLFQESLALAKDRPSLRWPTYEGLGRLAVSGKKLTEAERHFDAGLAVIEQTRSDLLKADYRLSFLTRLLRFYQQYIDRTGGSG